MAYYHNIYHYDNFSRLTGNSGHYAITSRHITSSSLLALLGQVTDSPSVTAFVMLGLSITTNIRLLLAVGFRWSLAFNGTIILHWHYHRLGLPLSPIVVMPPSYHWLPSKA